MLGIREQILSRNRSRSLEADDLSRIHHNFCVVYGWVSPKEFLGLPITTIFSLNEFVNEELQKREEFRLISLKYMGIKDPQ